MTIVEFVGGLVESDLERIEQLAAQNFAPSDIADMMTLSRRHFMLCWRDQNHLIRKRYELGRMQIEEDKQSKLVEKVRNGNTNAIQIHDKMLRSRRFENIKTEIFNLG